MKVYRLELPCHSDRFDRSWIGPYQFSHVADPARGVSYDMAVAHDFDTPWRPARCFRLWETEGTEDYYCGCASMQDLFAWFGGYLPQLMQLGGRIVVLDVPDERLVSFLAEAGERRQVVFDMAPSLADQSLKLEAA
jgi:hypothetical protein